VRNRKIIQILFVFLVPLIVFFTNLDGTWILDDHYQVEQNPYIRSVQHIPRIFATRVWQSSSRESEGSDIYRPVFLLSYLADYHLFGLRPLGFHFVNNLLHAINCVLLFLLAGRFLPVAGALLATLLFAVHPIGVEAVTWIAARTDLLGTCFALLNLNLIFRIVDLERGRSLWAWILFAATVPLGIFSKETFVLVPFAGVAAAFLADGQRHPWNGRRYAAMGIIVLVLTLGALAIQRAVVGKNIASLVSPIVLGNYSALLRRFFSLFLVPSDTDFFYRFQPTPFRWFVDLPVSLLLLTGVGFLIWRWRQKGACLLGLSLLLVPLIPVALVVNLFGAIYERYFYLPMAGFSLLLGAWVGPLVAKSKGMVTLIVIWIVVLSGATMIRNRDWHDEERLYSTSMARDPGNYVPHFLMAWHYARSGDRDAEIRSYYAALERKPDDVSVLSNLAVRLIERREFGKAEELLRRAHGLDPGRAKTVYNFGVLFEAQGRFPEAREWYEGALKLDPGYFLAQKSLARVRGR
jgi:hypothetical protein